MEGACYWTNSSATFGLVQLHPALILGWWPNEQAKVLSPEVLVGLSRVS